MRVERIGIDWHPGLPIFAKESFLQSVGDEYGWLGGFDESGDLKCVLPYTIIRKAIFRMARFRVETIRMVQDFKKEEEKLFLNGVVDHLRSVGVDMIIPATTNTIFRTYPDGCDAAPYGSFIIDLGPPEDVLWNNIDRIMRQNIRSASKGGMIIRDATSQEIPLAYRMIRETFERSKISFMSLKSFLRFLAGLGTNLKLLLAEQKGVVYSCCAFAYSDSCAYAVYAGNAANQPQGANKLLYWQAIRQFKNMGIKIYDFVGARINPEKGSKQEALSSFKKRFGATLKCGYMWKCRLDPFKYRLYNFAARLRGGGDIVDLERHKMKDLGPDFT